jgi:hypothetical protein
VSCLRVCVFACLRVCVLRVACCVLRVACCVLRVACLCFRVACLCFRVAVFLQNKHATHLNCNFALFLFYVICSVMISLGSQEGKGGLYVLFVNKPAIHICVFASMNGFFVYVYYFMTD